MTSASRFSFKSLASSLGRWLSKAEGVSLSHPSDLVQWNDATGGSITPDGAMRIVAVYACDRIIKESIASVPLRVYRLTVNGMKEITDHPLFTLLNFEPSPGMSAFIWKETLQHYLNLRGNAYCLRVESRRRIVALIPIHPDRVFPEVQKDGTKRYKIYSSDGRYKWFAQEEIWHLVGMSDDGMVGKGPIDYLKDAFGIASDAMQFAARSMKNDGATGITLEHPGKLKPETRDALKKDWAENKAGAANAGRPLLLEEGLKASRLNLTMVQMQFLESRQFSRTEIASIFRVPPHMIGDLERATFSNIEQQGIEFVGYTVRPWARRWEASLALDVVSWYNEPDLLVMYDLDELSQGDRKTRYDAYSSAILAGWMNRNEARQSEGYETKPGLDKFIEPSNAKKPGEGGGDPNDPLNKPQPQPGDRQP